MTKTKRLNFKQIGTKAVAFILAMITFLSVFAWLPLQVSAASSKKNTPSYIQFQAQEYASNFSMESGLSYASNLYDQLKADSNLQAGIAAWEAAHIVASPSHVNKSGILYKGDFYRIAIFDMLDASNQDSVMSFILENAYNDRDSAVYELANTLADEFDTDVSKLDLISMKDFKKFIKDFDLENFIGDFENDFNNPTVGAVDAIDIVFDVFNNASDAVNAVASYRAIANMRNGVLQVLNAIAEDENNDWALRNAAKDCVPIFNNSYNQILNEIATGVKVYAGTAFKTVASVVLDLGWSTLVSMIPGANALMFGLKGFRALMNATFDFDERNEIYYKIEAAVIIERAVRRIAENSRKTFTQNPNDEIASFYMESIYFYQKAIIQGVSYSIEYLENHIEAPGSQFLFWITGKYDDMENAIATAKSIKENRINTYAYIAQGVRAKYIELYCRDHNTVINKFNNQTKSSSITTIKKTNYTYDADAAIAFAKEHCAYDASKGGNCTQSGSYGKWLCAEFVSNCLKAGGFTEVYNVNAKKLGEQLQKYGEKIDGTVTSKSMKMSDFDEPLEKGDIVVAVYQNSKWSGHVLIYSGETYSDGRLKFYAHNSLKQNSAFALGNNSKITKEVYAIRLSGKSIEYKVTTSVDEVTNGTSTIDVRLNKVATVQKWTYFLSKDRSQVEKVDGTQGSTHKTVSGMDCVRILDYTSDPQKQSAASFTINKMAKQPLEANTTYYYKATVKIGSKWYESAVGSFTTANVLPSAPSVRVTSNSEKIGIGDQPQLIWDAVDNADSYNIVIKNSNGTVVQTKNNITGTTCVLDGFNTADTYTANIEAVNSAGTTRGISTSFAVMPNLTVDFYDPVGKNIIATCTVAYGHSAIAPKNPQQEGHTFSKWDKTFDKVTQNITVNAVYDVNSYTVKFVDGFSGKVLKTETVKYNENATPPLEKDITDIPDGYGFAAWDRAYTNVKSDLTVYSIYKWIDKDHSATITINSVTRNTSKQGYDVSVTVSNKIAEVSTGRVVYVLKSNGGAILATIDSSAFTIDHLSDRTIVDTIKCPELAPIIEVYAVNGTDSNSLGQISKVATKTIDNSTSSGWSEWITYTGTCPISSGNGVTVETRTLSNTTPDVKYYRYKILSTTTSYNTSISGWTQNGYTLVNAGSGSVIYVSNWHSGFLTSNSLYSQYNKTPVSAYENATQKVVIDSNEVVGYIYWHWCRGDNKGAINRKINWTKSSEFDTFHAFFSTEKLTYSSSGNAYKCKNTSCCKDTYWWNGAVSGSDNVITVRKQTYTTYNKLYNYYQYSGYSNWIEYSGNVPVANNQSAGTNKTYQNVETKTIAGTTRYTYQYRYMTTDNPTIQEPTIPSNQIYTLIGNVGSQYAGKAATVWVYKYDQASNENIQYIGTTTVGSDGSINIANAKLMSAPTIESGDYTVVASVAGQSKAIKIGVLEAPKPKHIVTFYDFDGTILSQQTITAGESAVLPLESLLHVPDGYRFTNWNQSVVNVRSDLEVKPECETETYVVAFVNWEKQTVELKECLFGAELIADKAPEGKDGYITEWVVQVGNEYMTIDEFQKAGYTVSGNMVVETRSVLEEYTVTIVDADPNNVIDGNKIITDGLESVNIATEYVIANGNYIDFSSVQMSVEENPNYIFTGWINAHTGKAIEGTIVDENIVIYPSYVFAETVEMPVASIDDGEYSESQTIELTCSTEGVTIWYTIDNTDPKISATAVEYTGVLTLSKSCVLRYYATALGKNDSDESINIYAINTGSDESYHIVTIWADLLDQSGSLPAKGLIKEGTPLPISLFNSIEGYDFAGIFYDSDYQKQLDYNTALINCSMELYAKYTCKKYEVVFKDYDGTVIETQAVEYLNSATAPMPPTREGYVFVGWDKPIEYIAENTEINAVYIPEQEHATVAINGNSNLFIELGDTKQLLATITTDSALEYISIWTSTDPSIVSVDENGCISAISVGSTTITVTLPYTGATAIVNVTVRANASANIVTKSNSPIGFDVAGYLRGVPLGSNTVAIIRTHFNNYGLVFCNGNGEVLGENDLVTTGTLIQLYDGNKLIAETTAIVTGDFNCDGLVNNKDIVMINQYIEDARIANEAQMIAIDVNGDGVVNDRDTTILTNYLVNKEALN